MWSAGSGAWTCCASKSLHLDRRGAELLFQVLTERDEWASIAVASNARFSEWGQTFSDPRLAGAVVDRLTLRAHILETGASSYRLRTSQARPKEGPPAVLISDPIEGQPIGRGWGPGVITVGPNGLSLPP
jgi:hypothetical protein